MGLNGDFMYDTFEDKINYYNRPELVNDPHHPAGFNGTFAFSAHDKIPEVFHGFIQRHFGSYKIRRVPLEQINEVLNELWEGPGSLEKIFKLERELYNNGKDVKFTAADQAAIKAKKYEDEEDLDDLPKLNIGFDDTDDNFDD